MPGTVQTYTGVMDDWMKEQREQEKKDFYILNHVKNCTSEADFKNIKYELEDSEHPSNYRIVNAPVGEPQYDEEDHYTIWINQSCGETGDNYSGTVCMKISDNEYFMWDYWM